MKEMKERNIEEIVESFVSVVPTLLHSEFRNELFLFAEKDDTRKENLIDYASGLVLGICMGRKYTLKEMERAAREMKMGR